MGRVPPILRVFGSVVKAGRFLKNLASGFSDRLPSVKCLAEIYQFPEISCTYRVFRISLKFYFVFKSSSYLHLFVFQINFENFNISKIYLEEIIGKKTNINKFFNNITDYFHFNKTFY